MRRLHHLALQIYRRLPRRGRRWIVRAIAPSFTVGAMCIIERSDGAVLLVRHSYRERWGVPGGLLERREEAADGARREVREEVGLDVELLGEPAVVVDAVPQRVDLVYRARPAADADLSVVQPGSVEITETAWFSRTELPALQHETTTALMALARSSTGPQADPIVPRPWSAHRR
jgi:8-oxo-dGTP diphosphatase